MRSLPARFAAYRMPARVRVPLTITLALAAVAASVVQAAVAVGGPHPQPIDYDVFGPAGADILLGRWHLVFDDPILQAGPFELLLFGIPYLLGVEGPVGWAVFYAVVGALVAAVFALVVHRVARPVSPDLAAPLAAGAALYAVVTATVSSTLVSGHPAQSAVTFLWIAAALLARRGRPFAAAAVLGLTLGWELWGILGAPVLLLAPRLDLRVIARSALGGLTSVVAMFGPFLLVGPVTMFGYAWVIRPASLVHLLFPGLDEFPWTLRLAQAVLAVGAGVAVAVVLRRHRDAVWLVPFAVCAVRLLTDPVVAGYYAAAPSYLAMLGLALAIASRQPVRMLAGLVLVNLAVASMVAGWVSAAVLTLAVAAWVVVVVVRAPDPGEPPRKGARSYEVVATREGRWWMIAIPEFGGLTNARRKSHVEPMARDWIALHLDVDVAEVSARVTYPSPAGQAASGHGETSERSSDRG